MEKGLIVIGIFFAINLIYSSIIIYIFKHSDINILHTFSTMSLAFIFPSFFIFMLKIELCKRRLKLEKENLSTKELNKKFRKIWVLAALVGTVAVLIAFLICIVGVPKGYEDIIAYKFGSILWGLLGVASADYFIEQHHFDLVLK